MRKVKNAVIYSALKKYQKNNKSRLCMPGHKGAHPLHKGFSKLDFTEIDELNVFSVLKRAEEDVAKILGAEFCKILSSGATSGILAMLYSVKEFGDKIIITRSAHKSIYSALKLFNIEPIILGGFATSSFSINPSIEEIETALKNNPTAIGVVLNGIDYFGQTLNLKEISSVVKGYKKLLLIDNAHGAHLFKQDFYAGRYADVWVDGAHKVLPTLNQGALICAKNAFKEKVLNALDCILTTSPCYPILASVEYGVKFLDKNYSHYKNTELKVKKLSEKLLDSNVKTKIFKDALKLIVYLNESGIEKSDLEKQLNKTRIDAELISKDVALFMFSPFNKNKDFKRLYSALLKVPKSKSLALDYKEIKTERKISYLKAVYSNGEYVDLNKSIGEISATNAGLFPPCLPIVTAGELITEEIASVLKDKNAFGLNEGKIKIVR